MADLDIGSYMQGLKLVANDAYFRSLAETLPHTMLVVDPDTYRIQYINRLQPGFTLELVIGREVFDFVWPEYHDVYRNGFVEVKKDRQTKIIQSVGQTANGEKAWYRSHISVLPTVDGGLGSIMLIAEDVTETKKKEIQVYEKSEKLNAIINNTSDIICSIDLDYRLTEFNAVFERIVKARFNMDLQQGMEILPLIDPNRKDHLINIYKRIENGETCYDLSDFELSTGGKVYFETSYHPIINSDKKIIGISIFSKDITERVKTEHKMKSALKEKEVLLSEIHHRIKNNLAIVSSLLQLQELNISNNEAREALSQSRKRIKSTALVHELLYRKESFESIPLNEYITELFELLKTNNNIQLSLRGNDISVELKTAMPLGLMLNEIMMNSFKHSYKDALEGQTYIFITTENNDLRIEYRDCKGEFPKDVDFENAVSTGLSLIHTFAEQLNGKIELANHTPPKYIITIPLHD